jgi:outer membrane protein assembly factor BamA
MLPQFDQDANIDQSQRYLFQSLANGVRGFRQNVRNGNTFFMASAELRFPVIRYLFNYNVRSEVLNNLQLIAFADVGSAFVGLNPYSEINTYVTHTVQQGPLFVTVKRQREPIIAGLGWGVRTKLLGYFIRVDVAKGIEDGQLSKTRLYISFGTDF